MALLICTLSSFNNLMRTQSRRTKKVNYCEDVNKEFFTHFYDLLYSNYNNMEPKSIANFPPMAPGSEVITEKVYNFNSRITDLRINRALENRMNNKEQENEKRKEGKKELAKDKENKEEEIEEVFEKEEIPIRDVPLYVENEEKKGKRVKRRKHSKPNEDMKEVEKEFKERIRKSGEKGIERAIVRNAKLQHVKDQESFRKRVKEHRTVNHSQEFIV